MKKLLAIITLFLTLLVLTPSAQPAEPQETLRRVAALGLVEQVLGGNPLLEGWQDAVLREGLLYWDLSGQPAFYEYGVERNGERAGRIKLAANPLLGTTVLSVESTPRPVPLFEAAWISLFKVLEWHEGAQLITALPLAYDGLKTGVAVVFIDPGTKLYDFEIVDLTTLMPVPFEKVRSAVAAIPPAQYSQRMEAYFAELDYAKMVNEMVSQAGLELAHLFVEPFDAKAWNQLVQVPGHLLQAEPHVTVDIYRCKLYWQETSDWCARAVLQMFNHYYQGQPVHSQKQIDLLLNAHGWPTAWKSSMSWYLNAYTNLSDSGFNYIGSWMTPATVWPKLRHEIDGNRPFGLYTTSGSTAHIAFDVGYWETTKVSPSKPSGKSHEYWLHVYDPNDGMMTVQAWKDDTQTYPALIAGYFHARP